MGLFKCWFTWGILLLQQIAKWAEELNRANERRQRKKKHGQIHASLFIFVVNGDDISELFGIIHKKMTLINKWLANAQCVDLGNMCAGGGCCCCCVLSEPLIFICEIRIFSRVRTRFDSVDVQFAEIFFLLLFVCFVAWWVEIKGWVCAERKRQGERDRGRPSDCWKCLNSMRLIRCSRKWKSIWCVENEPWGWNSQIHRRHCVHNLISQQNVTA